MIIVRKGTLRAISRFIFPTMRDVELHLAQGYDRDKYEVVDAWSTPGIQYPL